MCRIATMCPETLRTGPGGPVAEYHPSQPGQDSMRAVLVALAGDVRHEDNQQVRSRSRLLVNRDEGNRPWLFLSHYLSLKAWSVA